jgi:phosphopantothenoylcysteine decarboxylase/phosphopantothenate--cysteine ligase
MHTEMWEHPSVRENLATLERRGVRIVPPETGRLAGGDSGEGRLAEPVTIVARALAILVEGESATANRGAPDTDTDMNTNEGLSRRDVADLVGLQVVVSAGGTREPLDPVRYITNRSSGKQGHAFAAAAARRGAEVTLVTASPLALPPDVAGRVHRIDVDTAAEMERAMTERAVGADVVVMAAAVADFRPKVSAAAKLSKEDGIPEIVLEPTPDILAGLAGRRPPDQVLVGFAAETHDVVERGRRKLERKGVDLLVVNDVSKPGVGFDHDTNAVVLLGSGGEQREIALTSKDAVANHVLDSVIAHLDQKRSTT